MKRTIMLIVAGVLMITLSSCGQGKDSENDSLGGIASLTGTDLAETPRGEAPPDETGTASQEEGRPDIGVLEALAGEYEYATDAGTGKLIIKKTSEGYDISDYESEDSYRFLANSSNIETVENNEISIKYPEQVFADGTVVFGYYILKYDGDEIQCHLVYRKFV